MNCKTCNYSLWNLRTRVCPECGSGFDPRDFEYAPAAVQFCCPHCNQAYYGTDAKGHLVPPQFECVTCSRRISMSEMIVLPAEGVRERDTAPLIVPWLVRREIGLLKAWFKTIGWGFAYGPQVGRGLTAESTMRQAVPFAFITFSSALVCFCVPLLVFMLISMGGVFGGGGQGTSNNFFYFALVAAGVVVIYLLVVALSTLLAHGTLRLLGGGARGMGRTGEAIMYTTGPMATLAVPCVGMYLAIIGWIWWMISASLALAEAHHTRVWKGVVAMLVPGVLIPAVPIVGYIVLIFSLISMGGGFGSALTATPFTTQSKVASLTMGWRMQSMQGQAAPLHAASFMRSGFILGDTFLTDDTMLSLEETPVGSLTLADFQNVRGRSLSGAQQAAIDEANAALPADVVAHRLGDFVFTYHGIDQTTVAQGLWVVIAAPTPDPILPPDASATFIVGKIDGGTETILVSEFAASLEAQNALRARFNLAPLPMPETITHDQPAVAGDQ